MLKRRELLKLLGAAGAVSAAGSVPGCTPEPTPGKITKYVFMMMENRSYDHVLGSRKLLEGLGGDGLTSALSNPDNAGTAIAPFAATDPTMCVKDPPHSWEAARVQFDGGTNQGFVKAYQARYADDPGVSPMEYLKREHMPVTHALADKFASCDRWFASVLGPTLPNRMYWMAGSSNGATANTQLLGGAANGIPNVFTMLDAAGIDWAYYYGDLPVSSLLGIDDGGRVLPYHPYFLEDAAAGVLPTVTFVDPSFSANDDHPPRHPLLGQQLISATFQALATSPHWAESMMLLTYDEHGGFFDHVVPGKVPDDRAAQGFDQLGIRVPALAIGPWVKAGHVSSVAREHASVIHHLEKTFALQPLTTRTAAANDLWEFVDDARLLRGDPLAAITPPAVEVNEDELPPECTLKLGSIVRYGHEMLDWAAANPKTFGKFDRRAHVRDQVYGIAEFLDKHGLGRITRSKRGRVYV